MERNKKFKKIDYQIEPLQSISIIHYLALIQISIYLASLLVLKWDIYSFYDAITFRWDDKPWMPPNLNALPILSNHYFGDYQLSTSWAKLTNPFDIDLPLTFGLPPSALLVFYPFTILNLGSGYFVYAFITVISLAYAFKITIGYKEKKLRSTSYILLISSLPLFVILDRGNFVGIAFSAFVIFTMNEFEKRRNYSRILQFCLLLICISLKYYFIAPVVLIYAINRNKNILYYFTSLITVNIFMTLFIPGKVGTLIQNLTVGAQGQLGAVDPGWLQGGIGPNQFFLYSYMEYLCTSSAESCLISYQRFAILPTILWIIVGFVSIRLSKNRNLRSKYLFLISSIQFLPTVAMSYTLIWQVFAVGILLIERQCTSIRWKKRAIEFLVVFVTLCTSPFFQVLPIPHYPFFEAAKMHFISACLILIYSIYAMMITSAKKPVKGG
jgi:hypothetical protein